MTDSPANETGLAPGERPTLKTISQITGLAVATVSRALHDAPDIGEATKERVRETARRIGYRPNRAGVRLRTGKTNVISLIMSTEHDMMNHTARLISSLSGELRGTPYHLIITPYFPDEDPMMPVRYVVETNSADAIILNQIQPDDERIDYLIQHDFPFATHGRSNRSAEFPFFDFDNDEFARIGIRKLAARGRSNVLLIAPPLPQTYAQHIVHGATDEARRLGVTLHLLSTATSDSVSSEVAKAVTDMLASNPEIDGIHCASTIAAMAAVSGAEDSGRTLGNDIDIFAKEAVPFLQRFRREILTVSEDVSQAGSFLARAVIQRIADPSTPPMQGLEVPKD